MQLNSLDFVASSSISSGKVSTLHQEICNLPLSVTKTFHCCYKKSHPSARKETGSVHESLQTRQSENIRSKLINGNVI